MPPLTSPLSHLPFVQIGLEQLYKMAASGKLSSFWTHTVLPPQIRSPMPPCSPNTLKAPRPLPLPPPLSLPLASNSTPPSSPPTSQFSPSPPLSPPLFDSPPASPSPLSPIPSPILPPLPPTPSPSVPPPLPPSPSISSSVVSKSVLSFPPDSAPGPTGLRPNHLKEGIRCPSPSTASSASRNLLLF